MKGWDYNESHEYCIYILEIFKTYDFMIFLRFVKEVGPLTVKIIRSVMREEGDILFEL